MFEIRYIRRVLALFHQSEYVDTKISFITEERPSQNLRNMAAYILYE